MKQPHEETCKVEFDKLARSIFPYSQLVWEEVKDDPPDWFLTIDNARYAVEATTIVELLEFTGYKLSHSLSHSKFRPESPETTRCLQLGRIKCPSHC